MLLYEEAEAEFVTDYARENPATAIIAKKYFINQELNEALHVNKIRFLIKEFFFFLV